MIGLFMESSVAWDACRSARTSPKGTARPVSPQARHRCVTVASRGTLEERASRRGAVTCTVLSDRAIATGSSVVTDGLWETIAPLIPPQRECPQGSWYLLRR